MHEVKLLSDRLGIVPKMIPKGHRKPSIIENPNVGQRQLGRHAAIITEPRQRALNDETVETRKHPTNFVLESVPQ